MQKIKLLICDDHQIFIDGLKFGIKEYPEIELVGEALSGRSTLDQLQQGLQVDVVLLDVEMPGIKGPEVARRIKKEYPSIKVIGLTMHDGAKAVLKMTKVGVDGYLLKNTTLQEITQAIKSVHAGQKYFNGVVLNKIIEFSNTEETANPSELLTKRELQILQLITEGKLNAEIADQLYISVHTVNSHRKNMIKKLNLRNTAELISFSFKNNLIQDDPHSDN